MSTLALPWLFDQVVARFAAEAAAADPPVTPVPQSFGWREPDLNTGLSHRIVWVPGDDGSGEIGAYGAARQPTRNPRPLATLGELCTIYLHAQDTSDPENERKQYIATRELADAWYRHIYHEARGAFSIRSARWVTEKKVRRAGATIRILLSVDAVIPDAAATIAPTPLNAEIEVELRELEGGPVIHTEIVTAP